MMNFARSAKALLRGKLVESILMALPPGTAHRLLILRLDVLCEVRRTKEKYSRVIKTRAAKCKKWATSL